MTRSIADKRAAFRALHKGGCFILPNPWDVGSARLLQHLGFAALATTSSGYAWTTGHPDYAVNRDEVLDHLTLLCGATDVPVNADFESGFASDPQELAVNVRLALATGIAGLSIEDRKVEGEGLYEKAFAIARIKAARNAIVESGEDVILVARTEGLLSDASAVTPAIDMLVAFAEAGADCLYAPGVRCKQDIGTMVRAVAPKALNVLAIDPSLSVAELADLGVRRISVGGALARVALGAMLRAAEQMKNGSFEGLAAAAAGKTINGLFANFL